MTVSQQTPRIIAVDDDVSSAELVVRIAERCRYEAFATSDSRGVMNLVSALNPNVIAIDVQMPNLDAFDLIDLLAKAEFEGCVIIVSGQDVSILEEVRQHGISSGLKNPYVMRKPIDTRAFRGILEQCVHDSQMAA